MYYYKTDEQGLILEATVDAVVAEIEHLTETTEREIVRGWDGKLYFEGEVPPRQFTFSDYDYALEAHLDAEKAEKGYSKREPSDYAGSSNPRWAQDAADWIAHRDAVMEYGLEVENKARRGEPVPTLDEFKANLPVIHWTKE